MQIFMFHVQSLFACIMDHVDRRLISQRLRAFFELIIVLIDKIITTSIVLNNKKCNA